jgi:hypothetical protein
MDEELETLLVNVRASTSDFQADIETMRGAFDSSLTDGFARAGEVLEHGLLSAIRRGSLGFDDLKRIALQAMGEIAAQAVKAGLGSVLGSGQQAGGGVGAILSGVLGSVLGLPGRATGGPVSPNRPYWVGERGPELFVPSGAGRVEPAGRGEARDVRVSIQLNQPRGSDAPKALRRSARQVASSVRRAIGEF